MTNVAPPPPRLRFAVAAVRFTDTVQAGLARPYMYHVHDVTRCDMCTSTSAASSAAYYSLTVCMYSTCTVYT